MTPTDEPRSATLKFESGPVAAVVSNSQLDVRMIQVPNDDSGLLDDSMGHIHVEPSNRGA